jgi:uncharacterized protein DUF4253
MHRPDLLDQGPFRAHAAGAVPSPGTPSIHGIDLPIGHAPVSDVLAIAGRLAARFPLTGLWPLAWPYAGTAPSIWPAADLARIDEVGLSAEMGRRWAAVSPVEPFGGLAPAMPRVPGAERFEPFAVTAAAGALGGRASLLLVPCVRPADAVTAVSVPPVRAIAPVVEARLLRSFEDRFGAIPVAISPAGITLAVERPPTGKMQAQRLAAELLAYGQRAAPADLARALRSVAPAFWLLRR